MKSITEFLNVEKVGAKLLFSMIVLALFISNSPWHSYYTTLIHTTTQIKLGNLNVSSNFSLIINEGLMTLFFLMVGLEIKWELSRGSLNTKKKATLPMIAAIGGMVLPALIYTAFNYQHPIANQGWAIPTATDIAFSLSILSFLGNRVPISLKLFLTALAIVDDLLAIVIIAIFYTEHIAILYLSLSAVCVLALAILNKLHVSRLIPYWVLGICLWVCLLKSGIHPTITGVLMAAAIPLRDKNSPHLGPLQHLQHLLHPWVALLILPLFAFTNAGVSFLDLWQGDIQVSVVLGVIFGLFIGKQVGIVGSCWLATKFKLAKLPAHMNWRQLYGLAVICGVGFTISLFIGELAFLGQTEGYFNSMKMGVIIGSILSGCMGYLLLRRAAS